MRLPAKIEPWLTPEAMLEWVYEARAAPGLLQKRLAVWLTFAGPFYAARVAELLGVAQGSVWRWVSRYNRLGPQGLGPTRRGGRRHGRLASRQQEAEALASVRAEARAGNLLTAWPIRRALERVAGQPLSKAGLYRLLARHRWRKGAPRPRHPQTQPEALGAYKKTSPPLGRRPSGAYTPKRANASCCSSRTKRALGASVRADAAALAPYPERPHAARQVVRQYVYAAAAVSPLDGRLCSLVLPWLNAETMGVFLRQTAQAFAPDRCILFLDQAGWHLAEDLRLPRGMKLVFLPARSPELNPTESLWKHIREHYFGQGPLESLQAVEEALCAAFHALDQQPELVKSLCGYRWVKTISLSET
jgi:transposase